MLDLDIPMISAMQGRALSVVRPHSRYRGHLVMSGVAPSELPIFALAGLAMVLLAVSYDPSSLNSRKALLQSAGYMVVPASTLKAALFAVGHCHYDLLVLGATVPENDRQIISQALRNVSPDTSVLVVGGVPFGYADGVVEAGDAQRLLAAVGKFKAATLSR